MSAQYVSPAEVGVEVGDFFVASWGYDQTNVNFFKVVGLTPKGVRLQEWSQQFTEDDEQPSSGPVTYVVPGDSPAQEYDWNDPDEKPLIDSPVMTKRLQTWASEGRLDQGLHVHWKAFANLYPWDGKPRYQTGFGFGH